MNGTECHARLAMDLRGVIAFVRNADEAIQLSESADDFRGGRQKGYDPHGNLNEKNSNRRQQRKVLCYLCYLLFMPFLLGIFAPILVPVKRASI
jgi:hypothetical protein